MPVHNGQVMQAPVCCRQVLQAFQTDSHTSQASEFTGWSCRCPAAVQWQSGALVCQPVIQSPSQSVPPLVCLPALCSFCQYAWHVYHQATKTIACGMATSDTNLTYF